MLKDIINNEDPQLSDLLPAGFDSNEAMRILSTYLHDIEIAFADVKKNALSGKRQLGHEVRALKKINDDQQHEVERLTSDLMELTNAMEEQESLLSTANQKVANYEKQHKRLHRDNSELTNKLTQKENDADFYRQELERRTQEHESSNLGMQTAYSKLEDIERKLAVERDLATLNEKEARKLSVALSESQGKSKLLENKMEEMATKFNNEIRRLNERTNSDAQHEANLLKKRVRSSVAPEIRDMEKITAEKLSIEMASNLKALLTRLVAKLEQAGLDLK